MKFRVKLFYNSPYRAIAYAPYALCGLGEKRVECQATA
jgi:hypothetical protein